MDYKKRFIVVSKQENEGIIGNDSTLLENYFELGWEVAGTYIDCKYLLNKGILNKYDTIVTHSGREFLYENQFHRVINYLDFKNYINLDNVEVIDLVDNCIRYHLMEHSGNSDWIRVNHMDDDMDNNILSDINYNTNLTIPTVPYCCLLYRKRDHANYRNISDEYFENEILQKMKNKYQYIYVMGKGGEKYHNGKQVFYCNLQDWITLSKTADYIWCTLSGVVNLLFFTMGKETKCDVLIHNCARDGKNFVIAGDVLNYRHIKINFIG